MFEKMLDTSMGAVSRSQPLYSVSSVARGF